jgi:hypothetical protein
LAKAPQSITEPMKAGIGLRQQPARTMARRLVMFLIPTGIIPLRELDVSARIRLLGRRIPCHCLSVLALIVRLIAAKASPVGTQRALLCRHAINPRLITLLVIRPKEHIQRADG